MIAARNVDNTLETKLDFALKNMHDLSALNRSPLARISAVEQIALEKYRDRILPRGLALREILYICVKKIITDTAGEATLERERRYLAMSVRGMSCKAISQELRLSREHVSRYYRKSVLALLADEFRSLTRRVT
jgi:hypothetical protein